MMKVMVTGWFYFEFQYVFLDERETLYGREMTLKLQPDNIHDSNAVEVFIGGKKAGYVIIEQSAIVAGFIKKYGINKSFVTGVSFQPGRREESLYMKPVVGCVIDDGRFINRKMEMVKSAIMNKYSSDLDKMFEIALERDKIQ